MSRMTGKGLLIFWIGLTEMERPFYGTVDKICSFLLVSYRRLRPSQAVNNFVVKHAPVSFSWFTCYVQINNFVGCHV